MSALLAENNGDDNFFFSISNLKKQHNAAKQKKSHIPGSSYIKYMYHRCGTETPDYGCFVLIKIGQKIG